MHYVYVLHSLKDGELYTGYSSNLRNRITAHRAGSVRATRHRRPLVLIDYEAHLSPKDAKAREVFWKSGSGKAVHLQAVEPILLLEARGTVAHR